MNSRALEITTLILVIVGLGILSSSAIALSYSTYGENYYYLKHQLIPGLAVGILFFFLARKFPHEKLKILALPFLLFTMALLALVFWGPFGLDHGGARRWLEIGGFSFQPSELLKLSLVIYLASWLEKRRDSIRSITGGLIPFLLVSATISIFLIKQPDIGTLGVILFTALFMFFVGGSKISHLVATILSGMAAILVLIKIEPYRLNRLLTFLNPEHDPLGISYQINQAIIAIGSGGLFGVGIGQSRQKYNYLPEPVGDSIFAIASEEIGFVGASTIVILFLIFAFFGYKISKSANTEFGKLLGFGLTSWILVQAMINIAAISGMIPLTGVPLPFISFGGTSLVVALTSVGILSNIGKK